MKRTLTMLYLVNDVYISMSLYTHLALRYVETQNLGNYSPMFKAINIVNQIETNRMVIYVDGCM